jgi:hypothetical protein
MEVKERSLEKRGPIVLSEILSNTQALRGTHETTKPMPISMYVQNKTMETTPGKKLTC